MKTDNVLVSREKWEAMELALQSLCVAKGYKLEHGKTDTYREMRDEAWKRADAAQAIPDFIESEQDVEVVGKAIADEDEDAWESSEIYAQAAIGALRRKE